MRCKKPTVANRFHWTRKEEGGRDLAATLFPKARPNLLYFDFLAFFASLTVLALIFFEGRQPQPQGGFLLAIFITSFLSLGLDHTVAWLRSKPWRG